MDQRLTQLTMNGVVLVAGAGGFLGDHLVQALAASWDVVGAGRSDPPAGFKGNWHPCPDTVSGLAEAVKALRPDLVVDAAFVNRKPADQSDHEYLAYNQGVHLSLFEACAEMDVPVLLTSSSAVYGEGDGQAALTEVTPRRPVSLYGLAKTQQELQAEHVHRTRGLRLCVARLFNLMGPGRGLGTVVHDWVSQIARFVETSPPPVLRVRTQDTSRDFVDPRDAARALHLLAERQVRSQEGSPTSHEVFNVASGEAVSLRSIGDLLGALCPIPFSIEESQPTLSASDAKTQQGDARRLQASCAWSPRIGWRESVADIWRQYADAARPQTQ